MIFGSPIIEDEQTEESLKKKEPVGHLGLMVPSWMKTAESTGTTLIAVEYDGGVIIGADTRTSSGMYIPSRLTDKLTYLTDKIYCCRSGSAADTQALAKVVRYQLSFYEMEVNEEPSVRVAANMFKSLVYQYRDNMVAGIICAGWDKRGKGQIYMIALGGMMVKSPMALFGSGSSYVFGYADANFKPNMTREECRKFVLNGVTLAISRDLSSGGCVRLADINESGVTREDIKYHDLPRFFEG